MFSLLNLYPKDKDLSLSVAGKIGAVFYGKHFARTEPAFSELTNNCLRTTVLPV